MARPVTLFTGQWADLPLELLAGKLEEWGFDGVELAFELLGERRRVADEADLGEAKQLVR